MSQGIRSTEAYQMGYAMHAAEFAKLERIESLVHEECEMSAVLEQKAKKCLSNALQQKDLHDRLGKASNQKEAERIDAEIRQLKEEFSELEKEFQKIEQRIKELDEKLEAEGWKRP